MEDFKEKGDTDLLVSELTPDKMIRTTTLGRNQIFAFTFRDAPNLMMEVARLRAETYRSAGGGTGSSFDLDQYDVRLNPFHQLIVWNPERKEIIGGYRFAKCSDLIFRGGKAYISPFSEQFTLSDIFIKRYLPFSLELGRAWVHPRYQAVNGDKASVYALDNLWDGIGAIIRKNPRIKYLFGKVTIYNDYPPEARNLLLWYFGNYFIDVNNLVTPRCPVEYDPVLVRHFPFKMNDRKHDLNVLIRSLKSLNCKIPPLIKAYLNLSEKIVITKATFNEHFGNAYEPGIILDVSGIHNNKKSRYMDAEAASNCPATV